ncbi:MAG: signal peptide peptidase SppA [Desulfobacterota bacterium]|nr:signal peptide peptidase SppA [Thermodesulfobacteriota bacterium]
MGRKIDLLVMGVLALSVGLSVAGCGGIQVSLLPDRAKPLKEQVLEGTGTGKVLVIPVYGTISDAPRKGMLSRGPSLVEEVVAQLRMAERDPEIKAVVLKISSPGGGATASDFIYQELLAFKEKKKAKVFVMMMSLAASGGYYIALPADMIWANATTVTGSVGVIFLRPDLTGLMDKIGLGVEVNKSGRNKDMGAPWRAVTAEEKEVFRGLSDRMGARFLSLVAQHRKLDAEQLAEVGSARVYLAEEALALKLIDRIGYLPEALAEAKKQTGLPENAKVIAYRRAPARDTHIYSLSGEEAGAGQAALIDLPFSELAAALQPGFYYLWAPGLGGD